LANQEDTDGRCAREIADDEDLSKKYLESILAQLRTAGFVRSVRGARGGYILARSPSEITVAEVVRALEGSLALVECSDDPSYCERADDCVTRDVWVMAERALNDALGSVTIAGLVEKRRQNEPPKC
jgi:Rrf2 family protein